MYNKFIKILFCRNAGNNEVFSLMFILNYLKKKLIMREQQYHLNSIGVVSGLRANTSMQRTILSSKAILTPPPFKKPIS